jgi:hypothetical protein
LADALSSGRGASDVRRELGLLVLATRERILIDSTRKAHPMHVDLILDRDPWALVEERRASLRTFLTWAADHERSGATLRHGERDDIRQAREVLNLFDEPWWAVVVYTCFGSTRGVRAVAASFRHPLSSAAAQRAIAKVDLPPGAVAGHRQRPGPAGAKEALVAACARAQLFRELLHGDLSFEQRYRALRKLRARQWGRTTRYDLLARAGQVGIGGA